jgi:hypothetical protein
VRADYGLSGLAADENRLQANGATATGVKSEGLGNNSILSEPRNQFPEGRLEKIGSNEAFPTSQ